MSKEVDAIIEESLLRFVNKNEKIIKRAIYQVVITGECTLKLNDKKEIYIENEFIGCECGE